MMRQRDRDDVETPRGGGRQSDPTELRRRLLRIELPRPAVETKLLRLTQVLFEARRRGLA